MHSGVKLYAWHLLCDCMNRFVIYRQLYSPAFYYLVYTRPSYSVRHPMSCIFYPLISFCYPSISLSFRSPAYSRQPFKQLLLRPPPPRPCQHPPPCPLLSPLFPQTPPNSNKFRIHPFKLLKEPPKKPNPQSRIKTPGRRPYTMHTQLRDTRINRPYPRHSAEHRAHGAAAAGIVADLEDLEC